MSNWYYVNSRGQQIGPVSYDSLASAGLTPNTMVWTEGMPQWAAAGTVQQLSPLFMTPPPHAGNYSAYQSTGQQQGYTQAYQQPGPQQPGAGMRPNNHFTWAIISILLCTIGGIIATVYASKVNDRWARGDYNGAIDAAGTAKTWCIVSTITGALGCTGSLFSLFSW